MSSSKLTAAGPNGQRRNTIVNLKHVSEVPLRNALETFDKNGDGKIDLIDLQRVIYWYGMCKYASIGLCFTILALVWSTFGLTMWAINLTKDYTVTNGVLTGGDEVVKMSVASTHIPLSWASLLDRRHLDALEGLSIDVPQGSGKFSAGIYHIKVASYLHANSTYLKIFGADGSRVWVNSGTVVLHHPDAAEAIMVCGAAACNTMAVDMKPEYLEELVQRSVSLLVGAQDFELPAEVDGVAISKAAAEGETCLAMGDYKGMLYTQKLLTETDILARHEMKRLMDDVKAQRFSSESQFGDYALVALAEAEQMQHKDSAFLGTGVQRIKSVDPANLAGQKHLRIADGELNYPAVVYGPADYVPPPINGPALKEQFGVAPVLNVDYAVKTFDDNGFTMSASGIVDYTADAGSTQVVGGATFTSKGVKQEFSVSNN